MTDSAELDIPPLTPSRERLLSMLTYKRPHGSKHERKFINRFIRPSGAQPDSFGNYIKIVKDKHGDDPRVLFSSHTDSVHRVSGRQRLCYLDTTRTRVGLLDDKNSNCLGADCAAGVWLMLEMIRNKVPGVYVFHRQEETGGYGSQQLVASKPAFLDHVDVAIAFDRRGHGSVITHQFGTRCCSDAFGNSLRQQLGPYVGATILDDGGTFTDTANYTNVIAECTNVSIGFNQEHTKFETLDLDYADKMLHAMLNFKANELIVKRYPGEYEEADYMRGGFYGGRYSTSGRDYGSGVVDYDDLPWQSSYASTKNSSQWSQMVSMCRSYPESVADFLESYGFTPNDLLDFVEPGRRDAA